METTFKNKCVILSELWLEYRDDVMYGFDDFIYYNDVACPLAFAIDNKIVEPTPAAENYINESFKLLLKVLEIEDTGYETLEEMLEATELEADLD